VFIFPAEREMGGIRTHTPFAILFLSPSLINLERLKKGADPGMCAGDSARSRLVPVNPLPEIHERPAISSPELG
jgi:hypothetical protein